jgi:hypothetical protein
MLLADLLLTVAGVLKPRYTLCVDSVFRVRSTLRALLRMLQKRRSKGTIGDMAADAFSFRITSRASVSRKTRASSTSADGCGKNQTMGIALAGILGMSA